MSGLSETCPVAGTRGKTMMGTEWVAPRSGDPWDVLVARLWADDGAEIVAARKLAAQLVQRRLRVIDGARRSNIRLTGNPLCAYDLRRIEAAE